MTAERQLQLAGLHLKAAISHLRVKMPGSGEWEIKRAQEAVDRGLELLQLAAGAAQAGELQPTTFFSS